MRKSAPQPINALLKEVIKELNLEQGLQEHRIMTLWDNLLGVSVARATKQKYIKDRKLIVYLTSSVVRNELFMLRGEIVRELNKQLGQNLIDELVLK